MRRTHDQRHEDGSRRQERQNYQRSARNRWSRAGIGTTGFYQVVPDDPARIRELVIGITGRGDCQAILTSGGTGIAARDTTYEAVVGLLEKRLDGFGELFRFLSWDDIGSGAMLSRAVAGVYRDTMIFCMPGSSGAVRLAMEKLIVPELSHLVWEIWRPQK